MNSLWMNAESALLAFFIGLIPVLIWLAFWLFEDSRRPEPKLLIFLAFLSGMLAVLIVLPFQQLAAQFIPMSFLLIVVWAALEEILKLLAAWAIVLRQKAVDEPIDFPIYLITVALGFAALENAFFLFNPISDGRLLDGLITANMRFIGATLVHVLGSSIIGGALAFAYYRELPEKIWYGFIGVILAIFLHGFFNFLIINTGSANVLTVFLGVWVGIVFILLGLERVKSVHRPLWWEKIFTRNNN